MRFALAFARKIVTCCVAAARSDDFCFCRRLSVGVQIIQVEASSIFSQSSVLGALCQLSVVGWWLAQASARGLKPSRFPASSRRCKAKKKKKEEALLHWLRDWLAKLDSRACKLIESIDKKATA